MCEDKGKKLGRWARLFDERREEREKGGRVNRAETISFNLHCVI